MIVYRLTKCEGGQVSPSILDHNLFAPLGEAQQRPFEHSVGSKADFDMPRMDVRQGPTAKPGEFR
jgi:hypothetical protein